MHFASRNGSGTDLYQHILIPTRHIWTLSQDPLALRFNTLGALFQSAVSQQFVYLLYLHKLLQITVKKQ